MGDPNRMVEPGAHPHPVPQHCRSQRLARRRLPAPMYHYLEGGADDE